MAYDLDLVDQLCREIGLRSQRTGVDLVEVELGDRAVLCFQNAEKERDCRIGFRGTDWHVHDRFLFGDSRGSGELDYLDLLTGLASGKVLVCELWRGGEVRDRWLVHCKYNGEFEYLDAGDEVRVFRASVTASRSRPLPSASPTTPGAS